MFRPTRFYKENLYSFTLWKNKNEILSDIPRQYVEEITFAMGDYVQEPTKVSFRIPSHLTRNGETIPYPLYSHIRGKMQIQMIINQKDEYWLDIEEVSEDETKDMSYLNFTAHEIFHRLNNIDCVVPNEDLTRQLYRPQGEEVEIADGVLNWFEEQCIGWTVGYVDDDARRELSMCSTTSKIILNEVNNKVISNEIINQAININIGNAPLNMTIIMNVRVLDSNGNQYIRSTLPFEFKNIPYAITRIKAEYVSTDNNFYGICFHLTHPNGNITKKEFAFVNCKGLQTTVLTTITYETGVLEEHRVTKYRSFEANSCTWMQMLNTVGETFECMFKFNSSTRTVDVYSKHGFGEPVNIWLSYDNALREITKTRNFDDMVTRMWVNSSNTTIASVNPLGTDYIECYDYFKNGIMTDGLKTALNNYERLVEQKNLEFNNILYHQKYKADQNLSLAQGQLVSLEERLAGEKAILSGYIKAGDKANQQAQQAIVKDYENQVNTKKNEIKTYQAEVDKYALKLQEIGVSIQKENSGCFTTDQLLELADYLIEKELSDDFHLTADSLYTHAKNELADLQKPKIDFSIDSSMEFIRRTGYELTDFLFIGAKMEIEDRSGELADEDGTVMLYSFTIDPKTDTVSNINFTNGSQAPETPLRAISRTTQTAKATKSLTDFYKATWKDIKNKTVDIANILENGLDLSAQKIRSRTEVNEIDISEAGIFLIDVQNTDEQLALVNDLICMTTDGWMTSDVAISPEGVMARTLVGEMILGRELYIGNGNMSFTVKEDGARVNDANGTQQIFMGLSGTSPHFLVGQTNGYYMQWKDNNLQINANSIKIGSKDVLNSDGVANAISSAIEVYDRGIKLYVDNADTNIRSEIKVADDAIKLSVSNLDDKLSASIKVNSDNIALKVDKNGIISSINQSSENISINANKINLNGAVVFNKDESGNTLKDEYIKINDADYVLVYDGVVSGSFGMRDVEYDDYRIPRISLSASGFGDEGSYRNYDFFVINPYRGNKENPNGWDYPYVDIAYHSKVYDDWSNIKMFADGMIKICALTELEIRSNAINGKYSGTGEKLVAKFGTSSEDMYNGYLQIGAIVNTTNNNGLLLNHERVINGATQKTSIRVHTNANGAKTFRPSTEDGDIFCGSEGYPWYTVWSVNGHQTKSDKRYKAVTGDVDLQDCYDMVKNTNPYQYVTLSKNKDNMSQIELAEMALCNVGKNGSVNMGIMAQDILDYECSKYILSYSEEYDTYGINDYGFTTALMGAVKQLIQKFENLEQKVQELENKFEGE